MGRSSGCPWVSPWPAAAGSCSIVVLEDGHVAQQGAPAELMEQGGLYRRMVELQSESAQWRLNGAEA